MELNETTLAQREVYRGRVFTVRSDTVRLENGTEAGRDVILHSGGAGVLPIFENGDVLLVRQYRYGVGRAVLEIPAGKLEEGEDPKEAALRELTEETGAKAEEIHFLGELILSPAYLGEITYIYAVRATEVGDQHLDEDEFLQVERLPFEEAYQMALDGRIADVKTALALLRAKPLFF